MSKPDFSLQLALEVLTAAGHNPENCSTPEEFAKWANKEAAKIFSKYPKNSSMLDKLFAIIKDADKLIAEAIAKNAINCVNCEDCNNCVRCFNCKSSMNCYNCIGCNYIMNCVNCINCKSLNKNNRFMNNVNCIDCVDCMNCINCINSSDLMNESYMVNNRKVTPEQFQAEFQKYIDRYSKRRLFGNTPKQLFFANNFSEIVTVHTT